MQHLIQRNLPALKKQFKDRMGYELNLSNPVTIAEKFNWLKVYDSTFIKTLCADKIRVHDYVKRMLGKDICVPILKIYDTVPTKFPNFKECVIKCNHGSGMNIIVTNNRYDIPSICSKLKTWLNTTYLHLYEFHYAPIEKKMFYRTICWYKQLYTKGL